MCETVRTNSTLITYCKSFTELCTRFALLKLAQTKTFRMIPQSIFSQVVKSQKKTYRLDIEKIVSQIYLTEQLDSV